MRRQDVAELAVDVRRLVSAGAAQVHAMLAYANLDGAETHDLLRLTPAHDASRSVDRRVQRRARLRRILAADDHRHVVHAAADEAALAGKCRRRPLAHDPVELTAVPLAPGEIVMV